VKAFIGKGLASFSIIYDVNSESGYRAVHGGDNDTNSNSSGSTGSSWASVMGAWASGVGRGFLDCLGYLSYTNGNKAFANGDYINGIGYYITGIGEECFTLWGLGELYAAKTAGKIGIGALGSSAAKATAKTEISITNDILGKPRVGSALKLDNYHALNNIVDNYAGVATKTNLKNATLHQVEGSLNGVAGRFEWITQNGNVTHRMFVPGGTVNGVPIKP
jgi:hypothetical protein